MMNKLEIGQLFKEGVTRYPEGVKFDITDGGMNLLIYFNHPTEEEKHSISKEDARYGYYKQDNVIFMLFKFGSLEWVDAPYSIHLSKHLTELQEVTEGNGYAINVYLIDAATGILEVARLISMNTRTSKLLREDILKQKEMNYDGYEQLLSNIYRSYSTKALVDKAKIIAKIGN